MRLHAFWAKQGCVLVQPYNSEVGAGTLNPATFLRVLGPEPWRAAYVEPSKRPRDGRYGANFARLGIHPGLAVSYLLPRLIGVARAADLLFTGRLIDGD